MKPGRPPLDVDVLLTFYGTASRDWARLSDERSIVRKRDKQLSRAMARLELAQYDLLRQIRAIASQEEIAAAVEAHNDALDVDDEEQWARHLYMPRAAKYDDAALEEMARQKVVGRKRR